MLVLHIPSSLSRRARNHAFSDQMESESPGRLPPQTENAVDASNDSNQETL